MFKFIRIFNMKKGFSKKNKLQTRLLVSVGLILFAAFLTTAWLLSFIEEKNHGVSDQISILGVGFLILVVVLTMIYFVVKRSMAPLEAFTRAITFVQDSGKNDLKERLLTLSPDKITGSTQEIEKLMFAFGNLMDLVVSTWKELEYHQENLKSMVLERTHELEIVNGELEKKIVERQRIEEMLVNAQKLESVGTLAGGVAHDFNNLLMAIQGNAGLIQQRTNPGDPSNEKAKKIIDLVNNGAKVVQQLLTFARGGEYAPALLSINRVLAANLNMFNRTRKDLMIHASYQEDIWPVKADKSQMDQVAFNLFLNASEAMATNGDLSVETKNIILNDHDADLHGLKPGPFVRFSVADNGKGMDEEIRTRVFDPFFTTKQMGRGTGLGLASVYGIVKNHGGFVTVASLPGQGATFSVVLPAMNIKES